MKFAGRLVAALFLLSSPLGQAVEVAGIKVEEKVSVGGQELVLNGAGVRTRVIVDVYVGALYLAAKKTTTADVLAAPGAKRFQMTLLRDIAGKTMSDAFTEGIQNNASEAERQAVKARADELVGIISGIGEGKKGNVIQLDFTSAGTQVVFNGQPRGKVLPGEDFQRVLLRIWLGDNPVDGRLKRALLGAG
jgi:hypothetical protein